MPIIPSQDEQIIGFTNPTLDTYIGVGVSVFENEPFPNHIFLTVANASTFESSSGEVYDLGAAPSSLLPFNLELDLEGNTAHILLNGVEVVAVTVGIGSAFDVGIDWTDGAVLSTLSPAVWTQRISTTTVPNNPTWNYEHFTFSSGPLLVEVPPVVGLPLASGETDITGAGLVVGAPIPTQPSLEFPAGTIMFQDPPGGTEVAGGSAVNLIVSSGWIEVPNVEGKTAAAANAAILAAGLIVGMAGTTTSDKVPFGSVVTQDPLPKTHVLPGSPVNYDISAPDADFNVDVTVISQYANSPTLLRLVHNMAEYIDRSRDLATFYQFVWNVDTAVGFGLDTWGKIVGVSRLLQIPGDDPIVGFDNTDVPKDWFPMSQGRFATENEATTAFVLPDDAYRVLILTKALANIITTTAPAVNQLLRNLFPGRGRCFVRDLGNMAMEFVFNFRLTNVEYAILTQSGALPHPAGVFYSVVVIPTGLFGFQGYTGALPFNFGVFNSRP